MRPWPLVSALAAAAAILSAGAEEQAYILSWEIATQRENGEPLPADEIQGHRIRCGGEDVAIVEMPTTTFDARVVGFGRRDCYARTIDTEGRESVNSETVRMVYLPASGMQPGAPVVTVSTRTPHPLPALAAVSVDNNGPSGSGDALALETVHVHSGGTLYAFATWNTGVGGVDAPEQGATYAGEPMTRVATVTSTSGGQGRRLIDLFVLEDAPRGEHLGRIDTTAWQATVFWVSVEHAGNVRIVDAQMGLGDGPMALTIPTRPDDLVLRATRWRDSSAAVVEASGEILDDQGFNAQNSRAALQVMPADGGLMTSTSLRWGSNQNGAVAIGVAISPIERAP